MWYKKGYVNRRDWILENLPALKLAPNEAVLVLMIDYLNVQGLLITMDTLAKRTSLSTEEIDKAIHVLTARKALSIETNRSSIVFSLDGLFENNLYEYVDEGVFQVFETEFSRPLSQPELAKLNEWLALYPQQDIYDALRKASLKNKLSMAYIQSILVNQKREKQ